MHSVNVGIGIRGSTATTIGKLLAAFGRACVTVGLPGLAKKAARPSVLRSFALVVHDVLASRMSNLFTPADRVRSGRESGTVARVITGYGRDCQRSRRSLTAGGVLPRRGVRLPGLAVIAIGDLEP